MVDDHLEKEKRTNTNFSGVESIKFKRIRADFNKNAYGANDEAAFSGFPPLTHVVTEVQDWLWTRADGVGKFYKNTMKFDEWRSDYVKEFAPCVIKDWNVDVGEFSVGDYWDANVNTLEWWANNASSFVYWLAKQINLTFALLFMLYKLAT